MQNLSEMIQVISPEMVNENFIYFHDGSLYTLWSSTAKARSVSYQFKPLVGQSTSAMLTISDRNLICQNLFIYKECVASASSPQFQISLF